MTNGGQLIDAAPVRRVRPQDAARMRALRLEMLAAASTGPANAQFVADPGGRLVGHVGGIPAPHELGLTVVYAVYVTPARRGTGLLGDLVDAVASWSRSCGRPELMLEVVVGNDRAYRAYRRLGFFDTGVRVPHPTVPALTELQMRRPA